MPTGGWSDILDWFSGGRSRGSNSGSDFSVANPAPGSAQGLWNEAENIAAQERVRYQEGRNIATTAFNQAREALSQQVDPNLLFSKAADEIGARGKAALQNIRSSLGARGLNPNSGAAQGMLSRLIFQQQGALTGAKRDIALSNQKERQVNAALNFANALNLSGYINSPVSGIKYEAQQSIFEGNLAREGLAAQERMQRDANQTNLLGSILGGVGGIIGGIL